MISQQLWFGLQKSNLSPCPLPAWAEKEFWINQTRGTGSSINYAIYKIDNGFVTTKPNFWNFFEPEILQLGTVSHLYTIIWFIIHAGDETQLLANSHFPGWLVMHNNDNFNTSIHFSTFEKPTLPPNNIHTFIPEVMFHLQKTCQ